MSMQMSQGPSSTGNPAFGTSLPGVEAVRENLREIRACWCWFVTLGATLIFLGLLATSYAVFVSVATALVFGFILLAAGVFYIVGAFFTHGWGGFFLSLLAGVLHLAVGIVVLDRPGEALMVYTLLLAAFFFVQGLFWIVGALAGRFHQWGWVLFSGIVTLALGIMIWRQWPVSGLYVVGLFVGINLVINGASYIGLGLSARRLPG